MLKEYLVKENGDMLHTVIYVVVGAIIAIALVVGFKNIGNNAASNIQSAGSTATQGLVTQAANPTTTSGH
jgi:predicted negative regulator of RcsB-dependent stress response